MSHKQGTVFDGDGTDMGQEGTEPESPELDPVINPSEGDLLAQKVRLHNIPFAEQTDQARPRLQFIPGIDNHRILWLRNWLWVS